MEENRESQETEAVPERGSAAWELRWEENNPRQFAALKERA